jgi:glycosyltransferase involved in cell wall biosynthesis
VGYYGALADWFDYETVRYAANALPHYNFVLIGIEMGESFRKSGLSQLPNVFYLGRKDYEILPLYLYAFDVATIPFKINTVTSSTSPIKLFEYMAGGKPVVTSELPECKRYDGVFVARNSEEFTQYIQRAVELSDDANYIKRLQVVAMENTWEARVRQIEEALARSNQTRDKSLVNTIVLQPGDLR